MDRAELAKRLREQAENVEGDGWLNAARYMRHAADELDGPAEDDGQPDEAQVERMRPTGERLFSVIQDYVIPSLAPWDKQDHFTQRIYERAAQALSQHSGGDAK